MTEAVQPAAKSRSMPFRKSRWDMPRLDRDQARRQGAISTLAFVLLGGRDDAMAFLNTSSASLEARPIDLAMDSEQGYLRVEALIRKMASAR